VISTSGSGEKPSSGILDGLNLPDEAVRHAIKQ